MSCKYKSLDNSKLCEVIHGECQFQISPYETYCPFRENYKDYDVYWLSQYENSDTPVKIDNIMMEDVFDPSVKDTVCFVNILNIKAD